MRYFKIYDPVKLGRITLFEYRNMIKALNLQMLDSQYDIHLQAWVNQCAKATDKKGRSKYKKFEDFFDYKKLEKGILDGSLGSDKKALNKEQIDWLIQMNTQGRK